jgi:hypothetical protein
VRIFARLAIVCLALGAVACGATPPPRTLSTTTLEGYVQSFLRAEPVLIESLARSDPRVARRLGIAPPPRFTDPFQFDVRAIGLENVVLSLAELTLPEWRGDEPQILVRHRLEEELVYRFLAEEQFRLASEQSDVRRSAALLRAIANAWPGSAVSHPATASSVDAVLAWRLAQVRGAVQPFVLSEADRAELVDAIEIIGARVATAPLPRAKVEVTRLRAAVAIAWVAPFPTEDWDDVAAALHAFLGIDADEAKLLARIDDAARALAAQARVGLGAIAPNYADDARRRAAAMLHVGSPCRSDAPDSVVRSLAPPPERASACVVVRAAANAETDLDELVALVVLHDAAIVGAWSIALHGARRDPVEARRRWRPLVALGAEQEARLTRFAQAHPVDAVGAALAAALLVHDGPARVVATARAWRAFGDAPLDVVERELFGPRRLAKLAREREGARPSSHFADE